MNEFLEQFLIESRELTEQASTGLLALERAPRDAAQLDEVFRALHTLKGGAGIVEFAAMERAMHAAEDVLSAARAGRTVLDAATIGDCLACVDQVLQWLDVIERTGELPGSASDGEAKRIVARLGQPHEAAGATSIAPAAKRDWVEPLLSRHPQLRDSAAAAVRHAPDAECFFRGEDPVARMSHLPGLLALEISGAAPWPPLADMNAFRCNLVVTALTANSATGITAQLQGYSGELEIVALAPASTARSTAALPEAVRKVLAAQLALVRAGDNSRSLGLLASAARSAANALLSSDQQVAATEFTGLAAADAPAVLLAGLLPALERLLDEKPNSIIAAPPSPPQAARSETAARTLRVDADRIDGLVRLTGELTTAKNALAFLHKQAAAEGNVLAAAIKARHADFEHLTAELQRAVLALRVLPVRTVFQRFPRLLREMSENLGKPVVLKLTGEDTEADKAVLEMLFEPLLHVVRNAIDHGVESAAVRSERRKPREATIELRATRRADQVVIEVADDGGGIDVTRIRQVAAARSLLPPEVLEAMPDTEVIDLVFAPGFSTATTVTALSGRGVGMDAVRVAVERMGGRVTLQSQAGTGTTVRFMLPFSVMMTGIMSVEAGGQMFGVPLDSVVETIRVPRSRLAAVGTARALVVRDRTVPVLDLAQMLGAAASARHADATIVIAAFAGQQCGLEVDALGERLEIILRPLEGLLAGTPGITGTTLLGDGRVLLVLDIAELVQ